ncbi:MAG: DsrE family protein [Gammaproteobacteria bacterium]|nr:DsrE family protein [Gammaproteobacteria bacterium]
MKLGIVLYTTDAETVWNAFRLGLFALKQRDTVKAFLLAKGVECENLDTAQFKVADRMRKFLKQGGENLACGSCLELRDTEGSELCPVSTMKDLYELARDSDRVVTF